MKKTALLLALVMLFGIICASCKPGEPAESTVSEDSSVSEESSEPSESSGEVSKDETSKTPVTPVSETAEFCTVISTGCPYTVNVAADAAYQDSYTAELTDGLFAQTPEASYSDTKLSGYAIGTEPSLAVIIDLGETYDKIYHFEISYLNTNQAGIAPPSGIMVYGSLNGEEWTLLGRAKNASSPVADTMQVMKYDHESYVEARYIRFIIYKGSAWMFFDEFQVCADVKSNAAGEEYTKKLAALYGEESLSSADRIGLLTSVRGDKIDRTKTKNLISAGCKYNASSAPLTGYEDSGVMLTDGVESHYLEGKTWVGYDGTADQKILVDLGSVRSDIAEFSASIYANSGSNITSPLCMVIEVSEDKMGFTEVGRVYGPTDTNQLNYIYKLSLDTAVKGRYVRFSFASSGSALMLIEEAGVYAYGDKIEIPEMYPVVVLPEVKSDKFWSNADTKQQNLLLNLPQQIVAGNTGTAEVISNNSPITAKQLTDGKYSSTMGIHDGGFFKFNQGASRDVIYDLTALSAISTIKASFLNYTEWAVNLPTSLSVFLSDDGKDWYEVCLLGVPGDKDKTTVKVEYTFDTPIVARFVCYSFTVQSWCGADEFEVIGCKKVSSSDKRLSDTGIKTTPIAAGEYQNQSDDLLGGSGDICLMYHGKNYTNTEESLLPYVAYLDKDGNIKDSMFDGFLFLLTGSFPSGSAGHEASIKTDWEWVLDQLFASGANLDALNKVAGKVNEALGTSKKYNVFVTMYYPRITQKNFGDVDGDGKTEDCSVLANRLKVAEWFMTSFENRLASAGYDNLSFCGYYWYNEAISTTDDPEAYELLNGISDLAHEHGTQFFWIPYFTANNYSRWSSFGFDTACMQPNYAFKDFVLESRLDEAVRLLKQYKLCIEMEIDDQALTNDVFFQKYMDYLAHGVYDGYMTESLHMYYQGTSIFNRACYSDSDKIRLIYDYTYQFIKKTMDVSPDAVGKLTFTATKDTLFTGSLTETPSEVTTYSVAVSPAHGAVSINADGTFVYYPDKSFTGTDSFSYTYSQQLGDSTPCEVEITVG